MLNLHELNRSASARRQDDDIGRNKTSTAIT